MKETKKPLLYRIIKRIVRIFYKDRKVIGLENIPNEPVMIISNHSQLHGPLSNEISYPRKKQFVIAWKNKLHFLRKTYQSIKLCHIQMLEEKIIKNQNSVKISLNAIFLFTISYIINCININIGSIFRHTPTHYTYTILDSIIIFSCNYFGAFIRNKYLFCFII